MQKILIIGCSGCGKTTLSRALAKELELPLVHLDKLYWLNNWQAMPREKFDALLKEELAKSQWILDGNFDRTLPMRLKYCDTIIFMDYSRFISLYGVLKRVITGYGKTRADMGQNCPEKFDIKLLKFVWQFNKTHRQKYYELLNAEKNKQVIVFKNRKQAEKFIKKLSE
ncbi:AAA family ATPase [Scatolibacter rhodanostii]|uniref:AAA family ATPase n=1 Tax=Scatolibacter rhodanostii TaxID=2014781 RepID=UPI000C07AE7D|nr:AAA family ATPase [Scatolibacter rhodanostii]